MLIENYVKMQVMQKEIFKQIWIDILMRYGRESSTINMAMLQHAIDVNVCICNLIHISMFVSVFRCDAIRMYVTHLHLMFVFLSLDV